MKTYFLKITIVVAIIGLLAGCSTADKTNWSESASFKTYELTPTIPVSAVPVTTTPTIYTNDDIIEAYVTSNDADGNFYKSISFQSLPNTATSPIIGFSVSVNKPNLFIDGFTPGRKVYIKLKGLTIANVFGSMQIGIAAPNTNTGISGIEPTDYLNYLFPSSTVLDEESLVRHMNILNAVSNSNQNTLLEIDGVQFSNSSLGRTLFDVNSGGYATNHNFVDAQNGGTPRIIRFSQYATFSVDQVPSGSGSIRGVMTKYNSDYQYTIRQKSDLKLNNPRIVPLFFEDFSSNFPNWTKYSVTGAQVWAQSTFGNPAPCASISGYASGNQNNEDWLISPSIDFTGKTTGTIIFDSATKYTGNALQLYISTNYTSGAPSTATWSLVPASFAPTNSNFVWTSSGLVDISSYVAGQSNVRIAYKYTSTTSAAATWEVDNIKVNGN